MLKHRASYIRIAPGQDALVGQSRCGERHTQLDPVLSKRASTVLKLSEENHRLQAELRAMSERLEAAERRRLRMLAQKQLEAQHEESQEGAEGDEPDAPPPPIEKDD